MTPHTLELPGGIGRIVLSEHAIQRWRELACPIATRPHAIMLLEHVVGIAGQLSSDPPRWISDSGTANAYLIFGDYVIPICASDADDQPTAVTVIAHGTLTQAQRDARSRSAKSRRMSRAVRRRQDRHATARNGDRSKRREALAPSVPSWD